jgi:hypothetical protein
MIDPIGKTYHYLTVLAELDRKIYAPVDGKRGTVRRRILCRCVCGVEKEYDLAPVIKGVVKSCSCKRSELCRRPLTHGMSHSKEWYAWKDMLRRCSDPGAVGWKNYGGRGIKVCRRWMGAGGFDRFLADMGPPPSPKHTIDRMNNDGPYDPSNCQWATRRQQAQNSRRVREVSWKGRKLCIAEWSRLTGIKAQTIISRLDRGWSIDRALAGSPQEELDAPD